MASREESGRPREAAMTGSEALGGLSSGTPEAGLGARMVGAAAWSVGGQGVTIAAALIATPFTIRLLGPLQYGVLALTTVTLTYLRLAGLGMGLASTRFATDAIAGGDEDGEVAVIWTTLVIAFVPCAIATVAVWLEAGHLATLLHISAVVRGRAITCFRVASLAVLGTILTTIVNTSQLARLRWSTFVLVDSGTSALQVALIPVALVIWRNVVAAVVVIAVMAWADAAGQFVLSWRLQPRLLSVRPRRSLFRPILAFGTAVSVASLATIVLSNANQFLLARLRSVRNVAYYAPASTLAGFLTVGPLALAQPLLPTFTRARADRSRFESLYGLALRLNVLWMAPIGVLLFCIARPAIRLWAGPVYAAHSTDAFYIMLIGVVFNVISMPSQSLLQANNDAGIIARIRMLELLPYLGLVVALISRYGLLGAALAWSLRFCFEAVVLSIVVWRRAGFLPTGMVRGGGLHLAALALLAVPVIARIVGASDLVILALALVFTVAHGFSVWRLVLTADERRWASSLAKIRA